MPAAAYQNLVPAADLGFFTARGATVPSFRQRLRALNIPFNRADVKYELYYRIAVTGNRILSMPVGYVPAVPPLPPGWPPVINAPAGPPAPPAPPAPPLPPPAAPAIPVAPPAANPVPGRLALLPDTDRAVRRARMAVNKARLAAKLGGSVRFIRPRAQRQPIQPAQPIPPIQPIEDPEDEVVIEAEASENCVYNGVPGATIRLKLQVFTISRPAFRTLVGYYVYIYLRQAGSQAWEDLGSIAAWGISRPTVQHPDIDAQLWQTEWLSGPLDEVKYGNGTRCVANALRAIYNSRNGNVKARVLAPFRAQLASDGTGHALIYIQQLHIMLRNATTGVRYSGNGFAERALTMFYRLVQGGTLPIWYGNNGPTTYILEPGLVLDLEIGRVWEESRQVGESDEALTVRVQDTLTRFYTTGNRGYQIYATWQTSDLGFPTLGRFVDRGTFPRQPGDRIIGDWRDGQMIERAPPAARPANAMASPSPAIRLAQPRDDINVTPSRPRRRRPRRSSLGPI